MSREGLSRRTLLRAGGLSVVAASTGLLPGVAGATGTRDTVYDAVVIGAGFAGITAVRDLRARGLNVLLVEARERLGGRTFTGQFAGKTVELGGQWVGPTQQLVQAELRRYGIPTVRDGFPTRIIMPSPTGPRAFPPLDVDTRLSELWKMIFKDADKYFPQPLNPLLRRDLLVGIDGMSLRDRLDELRLSPQDESWISGQTAGYSGGSSATGGLTALAHWWALAGWSLEGMDAVTSQRPSTGFVGLLKAMLVEANPATAFASPVTSVVDNGTQVTVTTRNGQVFKGRTAVVATPVNVWKNIQFSPALPAVHATASAQGVGVPHSVKLWLHVRGVPDKVLVHGAEGDVFTTVLSQATTTSGQLMVAFNSLPEIDLQNFTAVERELQRVLPEASLIEYKTQDWGHEPYSLGGWALRKPNQLLAQLPAIQQPVGRLMFASGDTASGWNGFVEGAIESGMAAARQAVAKLSGSSVPA
ncbi:NAD(P)/FAD-dependent oxidoreductase [Actinosynnema sp. NPDC020468]|uniref:flavin monoamine oxidase family protein n=1 Tax=Actinosynnema sp. NPDC020468 TaxID=3154488 RepID=UPI0033FD203A